MALTLIGTLIGLAALVIQIIVWRTARTDRILIEMRDLLEANQNALERIAVALDERTNKRS